MSKLVLPPVRKSDALRFWLGNGQREKAAEYAHEMAASATAEELREIVRALADALDEIGDKRASRGRPSKLDPRGALLKAARAMTAERKLLRKAAEEYAAQLGAAELIADRRATPHEKARARTTLARGVLIEPRRTFATRARLWIAQNHGVHERALRDYIKSAK